MKDFSPAVGTMPLILCGPSALPAGGLSSGYINFAPCGSARQSGEQSRQPIAPSSRKACIGGESILVPAQHPATKPDDTIEIWVLRNRPDNEDWVSRAGFSCAPTSSYICGSEVDLRVLPTNILCTSWNWPDFETIPFPSCCRRRSSANHGNLLGISITIGSLVISTCASVMRAVGSTMLAIF